MTDDLTPRQLDLLISLTAGDLSGEELSRAEAEVAADPVLAAEYTRQLEALSFLGEQRFAPMTDLEAARMRRNVMSAVSPSQEGQGAKVGGRRTERRRFVWAARALPVAAALAVVVLGFGFVEGLFFAGGDTAETTQEAAFDQLSTEAPAETEAFARAEMAPAATEAAASTEAPMDMEASVESPTLADDGDFNEEAGAPIEFIGDLTPEFIDGFAADTARKDQPGELLPLSSFLPCDGIEVDGVMHLEAMAAVSGLYDGEEALLVELSEVGGPVVLVEPHTCEILEVIAP